MRIGDEGKVVANTPKSETHSTDPSKTPPTSVANRASRTMSAPGHKGVSGRAAAQKVDDAGHIRLQLPLLGSIRLPEPQRLTFYAAIGALGALGVLEWPVALVLAGGHALASDQHNRAVHQFGEALEDA